MDFIGFAKEVGDLADDTIIVSNVDVFFELYCLITEHPDLAKRYFEGGDRDEQL